MIPGSPIYFATVSARTKLAVDRANCPMEERMAADGRRCFASTLPGRRALAFVAVSGLTRDFAGALAVARTFGHSLNVVLVDTLLAPGADAGAGRAGERAFALGRKLALAAHALE